MAAALTRFVRRFTHGADVQFSGGLAILGGAVPSQTVSQAVEDLIAAHDGVAAVRNELRVVAPSAHGARRTGGG
jgi:hypothetical protein